MPSSNPQQVPRRVVSPPRRASPDRTGSSRRHAETSEFRPALEEHCTRDEEVVPRGPQAQAQFEFLVAEEQLGARRTGDRQRLEAVRRLDAACQRVHAYPTGELVVGRALGGPGPATVSTAGSSDAAGVHPLPASGLPRLHQVLQHPWTSGRIVVVGQHDQVCRRGPGADRGNPCQHGPSWPFVGRARLVPDAETCRQPFHLWIGVVVHDGDRVRRPGLGTQGCDGLGERFRSPERHDDGVERASQRNLVQRVKVRPTVAPAGQPR